MPRPPKRGAPGSRAGSGRQGPQTCCGGCPSASSQTIRLIKVLVKYATGRLVSTDAFKCPRARPRLRWIGPILGNLPHVDLLFCLLPHSPASVHLILSPRTAALLLQAAGRERCHRGDCRQPTHTKQAE